MSTSHTKTLSDLSCSVYASVPFKFIVEGEPFYIHTDLVSLHSKPLDRMMNGHMAEAQEGLATLKEVDRDTFVRFIEWAHKGYYTAAEFIPVAEDGSDSAGLRTEGEHVADNPVLRTNIPAMEDYAQISQDPDIPLDLDWSGGFRSTSLRKGKTPRWGPSYAEPQENPYAEPQENLRDSFKSRKRKSAIKVPPPRENKSSAEDYSGVFLSHARLYVFAEQYDIQDLKIFALDELHATLAKYTLYTERTSDIIDLLHYIYYSTSKRGEDVEDLRTLMTQYMGCEMTTLVSDKDFRKLMIDRKLMIGDEAALLNDFMTMVGRRIS